jgi:hypothetical protein
MELFSNEVQNIILVYILVRIWTIFHFSEFNIKVC